MDECSYMVSGLKKNSRKPKPFTAFENCTVACSAVSTCAAIYLAQGSHRLGITKFPDFSR